MPKFRVFKFRATALCSMFSILFSWGNLLAPTEHTGGDNFAGSISLEHSCGVNLNQRPHT